MAIPVIYKGDDTDFRGSTGFTLKVVTSSNLNLSGCTVEVEVLGFRRSFPASATGELVCPFAFTAAETQRMPLGIHAAIVRVFDSKGRVRTINNSIRVKVTNVLSEAYGKDDPQEVTLAVSTVDLEAYAKKEEVTAAITAAMKDASASVKLHALTPEVVDATVTLKPVDGKANWIEGKVAIGFISPGNLYISAYCDFATIYRASVPEGGSQKAEVYSTFELTQDNSMLYEVNVSDEGGVQVILELTNSVPIEVYSNLEGFNIDGFNTNMPPGSRVSFEGRLTDESYDGLTGVSDFNKANIDFDTVYGLNADGIEFPSEIVHNGVEYAQYDGYMGAIYSQEYEPAVRKAVYVSLPESAGTARRFSLALTTEAEEETDVTWEGGEVIEAFPGASKLVPGLNVWDVAEVAPGKFRVSRASSPAQSAPLTLTAPGGRVAELTVGDDLVLEVKEI